LFIHLLLTANHKEGRWQGYTIGRGQLITGLLKLNEDTGLTIRELRTSFDKLKKTGELTIKTTNKFRIITICKYDTYQSIKNENDKQYDNQIDKQTTSNRQTNDKQPTTNNNENNNKEDNKINNNKINAEGDKAAPAAPASVPGLNYLPDGRSYIEPLFFYTAADFNGLPEDNLKSVLDFFDATKGVKIEPERVTKIWSVFKTQELTQQKPYRNKEDVYRHFLNWTKKQSFAGNKTRTPSVRKEIPKNVKVIGVKFINDFTQCEMTDGSIQDLSVNQKDMAKYNQINPSSIAKI